MYKPKREEWARKPSFMKSLALAVAIGFTSMMAALLATLAVAAMDNPGVHINSIRLESYTMIAEVL